MQPLCGLFPTFTLYINILHYISMFYIIYQCFTLYIDILHYISIFYIIFQYWIKMHSTGWTWITTKLYATTLWTPPHVHIIYQYFTLYINILNQNAFNQMDMNNNTNIWNHSVEDDDTAPEGLKAKCFTPAAVIFMFPFTGKNITLLFTCFDKWGTHMSRQYASICFHNFQFLAKTISPLKRGKH